MSRSARVVVCGRVALAAAGVFAAADRRDYQWFLRYMADLDRLAYLEPGVVSRQFSSYCRTSRYDRDQSVCVGMDANGDSGNRLSVHFGPNAASEFAAFKIPATAPRATFGDLEWVLDPCERNHVFFLPQTGVPEPRTKPPENVVAAIQGPGCIFRIWSANPMGKIQFYFDGSTTPLEFDFKSLFLCGVTDPDEATLARRAQWPFIRPLTFRRTGAGDHLASDCYLPIPFAKSCLIALTQPAFYQIGYKTFPGTVEVETFRLPLTPEEDAVLAAVCTALLQRGKDPKPTRPGTESVAQTVDLPPGTEVVLADLTGPRLVQAVHAKLEGHERYAASKVLLTASFDDEPTPCVWAPLVNFFGTGFTPRDYRSLPLGYVDGEGYCYFPMPFRQRGRFVIRNEGVKPAVLAYRIVHAPADAFPANTMYFKCKYRREEASSTFDYPFLRCEGSGRFVGASLCIDDAWRSWWGEGDEKLWVDDDLFPSFFGTGSEDFFGDAWGIRTLHQPFFACSLIEEVREHAWTCCYRWLIPDDVPFRQRLTATIENYPESQWGPAGVAWDEDYVSVAYWYQMPGGSDFFVPVPVAQRRPWGKVPTPPVIEAEDVLGPQTVQGATIIDDEGLAYEFSRGRAVDLGQRQAGDTLVFRGPEIAREGPYTLTVHTARGSENLAAFVLLHEGKEVGATPPDYGKTDECRLGAAVLSAGTPRLQLRFTSAGRAVLDCFQFGPARQLRNVVEAETAQVILPSANAPLRDIGVLWSAGWQLRFPAQEAGYIAEIDVDVPAGQWHLCAGLTRGPQYGNWEVSVNGQGGGLLAGFAPQPGVLDWLKVGKLKGANGKTRLRFVCTGRDPKATGSHLGLDYVGWQRIVVEDALEGETAEVVDIRDGRRTDQLLGERFSGGNHLWFHPQKIGASFTWLLDVPEDGTYQLVVYFTKSWDYAIVSLSLDGKALGEFDTYAPAVTWAGPTQMGSAQLTRGKHRLTFEVKGRNEQSKGILVGVDCLTLKKR